MKQRFRYSTELGCLVEVLPAEAEHLPSVRDDLKPFISPRDGTLIKSRSQLRDYLARHDLVPYDPGISQNNQTSIAQRQRDQRQRAELLWEGLNKTFSMGNKPRK